MKEDKLFWGIVAVAILGILVVDFVPKTAVTGEIDDWQYNPEMAVGGSEVQEVVDTAKDYPLTAIYGHNHQLLGTTLTNSIVGPGIAIFMAQSSLTSMGSHAQTSLSGSADLGYATGGAKDINNFRDNIEEGYLPLATDIPYEGLFYEYYFDTGQEEVCKELFCPSYSRAVTEHSLEDETERYVTVGLNSNLKENEFERKKLNLIIVMDISGSMSSSFDQYYYDRFGNRQEVENYTGKSKMQVARESLKGITQHLEPEDRVGVVLFNNGAHKAKPLNSVEDVDMDAIREHIEEIEANGGTDMEAGMDMGTEMLEEYEDADQTEYENRIIFMTDMMPNLGTTSDEGLLAKMKDNAENNIHTSFIGIGVDFNTELTDAINGVKGANSFAVHSAEQFKNRMNRDFKYMVTPLVYNLNVELNSDGYRVEDVYGSSIAEDSTEKVIKVKTLFPSRKEDGKTKGGVVLAELEKTSENPDLEMSVSYERRNGEEEQSSRQISFEQREPEYFENSGIRKAVLLKRYASLMKEWVKHERQENNETEPIEPREPGYQDYPRRGLGEQERQSQDLTLSKEYEQRIREFKDHFENEIDKIGDSELEQEVELMQKILDEAE